MNEYSVVEGTNQDHDSKGDLMDDGTLVVEYDALNRIVEVKRKSDNTVIAVYNYDAGNRRVKKVVTSGGKSGSAVKEWDGT